MEKSTRFNLTYLLVALIGVVLLHDVVSALFAARPVPYSEFRKLLADGKLSEVVVVGDRIEAALKESDKGASRVVTTRVDAALAEELARHGVTYSARRESRVLATVLSWVVPVLLFFALWVFLMRRVGAAGGAGGGLLSIGKSKAKVYVETGVKVRFADVAGVEEAKGELSEIVAFLKDPAAYGRLGARMPRGVLLVGPPGTGKTLLARAVAGEAGVPFFSISGSEFVEMFVGVGAARVQDLF